MWAKLRRLVDILSTLAHPQKTGLEPECCNPSWPEPDQLKLAIHYLVVSARHFRSGGIFLRLSAKHFSNSIVNSAKHLTVLGWRRVCGFQQSGGKTSHCSCPPENTQNKGLSNTEKVDCNQPISDPLNPCQNPQKSTSPSGGNTNGAPLKGHLRKSAGRNFSSVLGVLC